LRSFLSRKRVFLFKKARSPLQKARSPLSRKRISLTFSADTVDNGLSAIDGKTVVTIEMIFHIIKEAAVNTDSLVATGAFHMEMIVMPAGKTVERAFANSASVET